ncbi:MAG: proline--tRNA ligase, partial [Candidatus Chisholmbacteria bacterium]|nr:proline--tRNA ligase [Candidatus Chisholmbacteria bacterium]
GDIGMCEDGFLREDGKKLKERRGIEVGNIFQLGYHYTKLMKGAVFVDENGKGRPYYMGCYGIGIGRTMAAIVEKYHDDKGIVWPESVAPFQAHLVDLASQGDALHEKLVGAGIEVLWDDREESAGVKFADVDLIGIPVRLVVSAKTGGKVEWKKRDSSETELVSIEEVIKRLV